MKVLKSINSVYTLRYRKKKSKFQYNQSRTKNIIEINHVKKTKTKKLDKRQTSMIHNEIMIMF